MNMFKKSRKAREQDDAFVALTGTEPNTFSKASRALTRKKKKQPESEVPQLNLSTVLPSSTDFRTSLLMPQLSARFSMLREQNDPNSKIGKASDDSVLFPKRASRMNLFDSNPLADIAEIDSLRSFRPPFASGRNSSYSTDGYQSDEGSVMSRARPGEGNNLFGGRQKLYMINSGSSRGTPEGGLIRGKHTYESDVALSAFQQLRLREKQQIKNSQETGYGSVPTDMDENESSQSIATAFSQNRGTQSSTHSGPIRRTSTAATSITSDTQPQSVVLTKVREYDANSSLENIGYASSPSFRRVGGVDSKSPKRLSQSRSATGLRETYSRSSPTQARMIRVPSPSNQNFSPQLDFGLSKTSVPQVSTPNLGLDFDFESTLASSVQPNDRGKATALGLFNKPQRHYDDEQFQQRQVQMHQSRNSPSPVDEQTITHDSTDPIASTRPSSASSRQSEDMAVPPQVESIPQIPPIPQDLYSPTFDRRLSSTSTHKSTNSRSRARSTASQREAIVEARIKSLIEKQNAELAVLEAIHAPPSRKNSNVEAFSPAQNQTVVTLLDRSTSSNPSLPVERSNSSMAAAAEIHPAFRDGIQDFNFGDDVVFKPQTRASQCSHASTVEPSNDKIRRSKIESARLAQTTVDTPTTSFALSGMIRTHLRSDSDKSSMYPPPSPGLAAMARNSFRVNAGDELESERPVSHVDKVQETYLSVPEKTIEQPPTPTTVMSNNAQNILNIAKAMKQAQAEAAVQGENQATRTVGKEESLAHQRSESTETQREMRRFDEELAARRRKIEESLRTVEERSQSRSPSTDQGAGFSLPKFSTRSNSNERVRRQGGPPTAGNYSISRSSEDADVRTRNNPSRNGSRPPNPRDERSDDRYAPGYRAPSRTKTSQEQDRHARSTTPSSKPGSRARSNSAANQRSQSRNHGREQDTPVMPGGFPASPMPYDLSQRPSSPTSYTRSTSSAAGRYDDRSYFNQNLIPASIDSPGLSPGLSSGAQSPARSSPNSGFQNERTGSSMSGRMTPSGSGGRKRSVNKGMISEPTFLSSTASVPLVQLPRDGGPSPLPDSAYSPSIPPMNPRRRGTGDMPSAFANRSMGQSLATVPASPVNPDFSMEQLRSQTNHKAPQLVQSTQSSSRPRNKLRKVSSEGGNMASRARQQAVAAEMKHEQNKSPATPVFPNRSATNLGMSSDGGMF